MRLALGIVLMWLGCSGIYVATHGTQASNPFAIYQELMGKIANA
jgi:hypothetical protein